MTQVIEHQRWGGRPRFQLASSVQHRERAPFSMREWAVLIDRLRLSQREVEILKCVAFEMKDLAIAVHLGIAKRTVRTHFERLYKKLGVSSKHGVLVVLIRTLQAEDRPNRVSEFEPTASSQNADATQAEGISTQCSLQPSFSGRTNLLEVRAKRDVATPMENHHEH